MKGREAQLQQAKSALLRAVRRQHTASERSRLVALLAKTCIKCSLVRRLDKFVLGATCCTAFSAVLRTIRHKSEYAGLTVTELVQLPDFCELFWTRRNSKGVARLHVILPAVIPSASVELQALLPDEFWPAVSSNPASANSVTNEVDGDKENSKREATASQTLRKTLSGPLADNSICILMASSLLENARTIPSHLRFDMSEEAVAPLTATAADVSMCSQPQPHAAPQSPMQASETDAALMQTIMQLLPQDLALIIEEKLASHSNNK